MRRIVAVTGATGFLGLHLVKALAREGVLIRILARRDPVHEFWAGIEYETVFGDIADAAALARLVAGADAVVHAAGVIAARSRAEFLAVNRDGAEEMARVARRVAPRARFILVSTLAAREPRISDYAFSKRAGEEAVRGVYAGAEGQLVIIRPPALYGPWDKATLPIFRAAGLPLVPVLSGGRVSVLHVADAAGALAGLAMGAGEAGLFALPGGDFLLREVMAAAALAQGRRARLVQVPAWVVRAAGVVAGLWGRLRGEVLVFSAGKARELLHRDWVVRGDEALPGGVYWPRIGIGEGFGGTVAWYRARGWLR